MEHTLIIIQHYTYFVLLPLCIIEGPIVTVIASFLASQHVLNIFLVYPIVVIGDILGDLAHYWLGRYGRYNILPKYGKYMGVTSARLETLEDRFSKKKIWKTIFFGKFAHAPNSVILTMAGAARVDIVKFVLVSGTATAIKSLIFVLIGWYLGASYQAIGGYIDKFGYIMIIIICIFIPIIWIASKMKK